jgi:hypothetical protein
MKRSELNGAVDSARLDWHIGLIDWATERITCRLLNESLLLNSLKYERPVFLRHI